MQYEITCSTTGLSATIESDEYLKQGHKKMALNEFLKSIQFNVPLGQNKVYNRMVEAYYDSSSSAPVGVNIKGPL